MIEKLKVVTYDGNPFLVNVSDEACRKSGFDHAKFGAKVIAPDGKEAKIIGVAPWNANVGGLGNEVTWILLENVGYHIIYWYNENQGTLNLKEVGFKLKE